MTPPDTSGAPDGKLLERVRALLAKAESTSFPEEAEALSAKAQDLMARHAIDRALLDTTTGRVKVLQRSFTIERPYVGPKQALLGAVAAANRCQAVGVGPTSAAQAEVFGSEDDLEATELLFTSLLVQATTAMLAEGSRVTAFGESRTRSFRHAFLMAYAVQIGSRLRETVDAAVEASGHGTDLVPVFDRHRDEVDRAMRDAFPHLRSRSTRVSNGEGVRAGRAAAARADLGQPGVERGGPALPEAGAA